MLSISADPYTALFCLLMKDSVDQGINIANIGVNVSQRAHS